MKTGFVQAYAARVAKFAQQNPLHVAALVAAMLLGGAGASYAVGTLANDVSNIPSNTVVQAVEPLSLQTQTALIETQALRLYRSDVSRSTDSAESLLTRVGVFDTQAAAFMRSNPLVQQTLLGRGGRNLTVEASEDNRLLQLTARWSPDDDGNFKRLSVERTTTGFEARIAALPLSANTRLASGTIQSSLFAATDEAHIPDAVATQLAEIFSGDIDFHRALRKGDRFSVVYEALEGDGEALRSGRVLSAEFVNAGKTYQAMWFQEPPAGVSSASRAPSKGGYYTLGGTSLRRAFLAAPLEFSRVTSGFKMRLHPILQTMRAHQGVDYGAPTGTPVRTVGDGVVEFAGVQNGFGNVVIVKQRRQGLGQRGQEHRLGCGTGFNGQQGAQQRQPQALFGQAFAWGGTGRPIHLNAQDSRQLQLRGGPGRQLHAQRQAEFHIDRGGRNGEGAQPGLRRRRSRHAQPRQPRLVQVPQPGCGQGLGQRGQHGGAGAFPGQQAAPAFRVESSGERGGLLPPGKRGQGGAEIDQRQRLGRGAQGGAAGVEIAHVVRLRYVSCDHPAPAIAELHVRRCPQK